MPKFYPVSRCGASVWKDTMHNNNRRLRSASQPEKPTAAFEIYADMLRSLIGTIGREHVREQMEAEYVARGFITLEDCTIPIDDEE